MSMNTFAIVCTFSQLPGFLLALYTVSSFLGETLASAHHIPRRIWAQMVFTPFVWICWCVALFMFRFREPDCGLQLALLHMLMVRAVDGYKYAIERAKKV